MNTRTFAISIQGQYEPDLWIVEEDQGQMQQVLMNLYVNAWQAMRGGGVSKLSKVYKKNRKQIDLVILDMIMPDMDGGETFERLKAVNSDIKALLSNGYSLNARPRRFWTW
ncbi:MAG: response regulator [Thermodesulfobacteriota bacterium]|nr:response regulator [Thermodesulfobacteriota bacterium]